MTSTATITKKDADMGNGRRRQLRVWRRFLLLHGLWQKTLSAEAIIGRRFSASLPPKGEKETSRRRQHRPYDCVSCLIKIAIFFFEMPERYSVIVLYYSTSSSDNFSSSYNDI